MHDRREFLRGAAALSFSTWIGAELAADSLVEAARPTSRETAGGILRLRLQASRLEAQSLFYGQTLGWPVAREGDSLRVRAGGTEIVFDPTADDLPKYHIAWAIPCNKLAAAKAWLAARTSLLQAPDGRDEFHFQSANRRGVYFADADGSILELIARDDLGDVVPGPFTLADLLYVNHVGLVVDDMDASIAALGSACGLRPMAPPQPTFTTLGDAHRHVVLVPRGRLWIPERVVAAAPFATEVVLHGSGSTHYQFVGLPYQVTTSPDRA